MDAKHCIVVHLKSINLLALKSAFGIIGNNFSFTVAFVSVVTWIFSNKVEDSK